MKKVFVVALALMVVGSAVCFAGETIIIEGSTTVLPIAQRAAEVYMDNNPSVDISVRGGGSGVGVASMMEGRCDIGDSSRPMKTKEIAQAAEKGIMAKPHVVAMDGIAVIVHPSNSLSALTKDQLKNIYTGNISDWSQVGGKSGKIVVVSRDTASGTYEAFNKLALDKAKVRPDALLQASNKAVLSTVAKTPAAIGYVGLGYLTSQVKDIPIDGVKATKETVLTKTYPLARPLFMYTNGEPTGAVKGYLDFVKGAEGQKLAEEEGFVGLQ